MIPEKEGEEEEASDKLGGEQKKVEQKIWALFAGVKLSVVLGAFSPRLHC